MQYLLKSYFVRIYIVFSIFFFSLTYLSANQWNIMIYANGGDAKLDQLAREMLINLAKISHQDNVRVTVQTKLFGSQNSQKWFSYKGTRRFIFNSGKKYPYNFQLTQDLGINHNMGCEQSLKNFINKSYSKNPLEKNILILWCHGFGLKGLCNDTQFHYKLNFQQFANALGNHKFEVIHSNACSVQNFELAYAIRKNTDYFIASQPETWLNYHFTEKIIRYLQNHHNTSSGDLARTIVALCTDPTANKTCMTRSAIKTSHLDELKNSINELGEILYQKYLQDPQNTIKMICAIRQNSLGFYDSKDLLSFLKALKKESKDSTALITICDQIANILNKAVFAYKNSFEVKHLCGLSIGLSLEKESFLDLYSDAFYWHQFLKTCS